eukprot:CAMPEP_0202971564 /NCGR_PEP_ID=MMETSP1396-20130829/28371_1 /ASSEMBLY_ACC=CAM_ASM_000872 /TAXON_ID= /ORGANISM="Pseudokeronopsis sp., Strain Brazil" /LENGTH=464 /DNA_ID=CAMNT_0049701063 /DNA_START=25 /DNA_END=1419 /DNA_ORIENTATION=+
MIASLVVLLALIAYLAAATDYPPAGPTFAAKDYTVWSRRKVQNSRLADITVNFKATDGSDDSVHLYRLDMVGTPYERGFAQGSLMTKEIVEFLGPVMDKYYADEVLSIDLSGFPEPLQSVLRALQLMGAAKAPELFKKAMAWVWEQEKQYVPQYFFDEIQGIADGLCSNLGGNCNAAEWSQKIQELNMLPELVRMACTAFGAWGPATPSGKGLLQVRALDFGGGPWVNYTVIATHRGDPSHQSNAFTAVTFPAFVGVVTGVSQSGIGISEKVWMTYDKYSLQPGSYDGVPDVYVLRHILQEMRTRADAEKYMESIKRTWGMWVGIGDYTTMRFDLVAYKQESSVVYDDWTIGQMTGQPYIQSVAYVDKHPQPTGEGPTGTLPTALKDFWGNITNENAKTITHYHQTGDVHIASYDFENSVMYVAIGKVNKDGQYGPEGSSDMSQWKAHARPYIKFDLNDLWAGN